MDTSKFEKDMAVFSFGQIQDFVTFLKTLHSHGYAIGDVENYIEIRRSKIIANSGPMRGVMVKCPECGSGMMILPVNDKTSTQTGDDSKSVMMCRNNACRHTEYSEKTRREIVRDLEKESEKLEKSNNPKEV